MRRGARVVAYDLDSSEVKDTATVLEAMARELGAVDPASRGAVGSSPVGTGSAVNGDALALPFPDATFDRVIASEILEHIPADTAAMAELFRVVRPGGSVAVTVPRFGPELVNWALSDAYHQVPGGHIRIYRQRVLSARLTDAGLRPVGRGFAHGLHSPYWWLRCAVGLERDDHWSVRAYHQVLVWDIERTPVVSTLTRAAEAALNPFIGKSVVIYAVRPPTPSGSMSGSLSTPATGPATSAGAARPAGFVPVTGLAPS
jgi:SAM-dependent methyltransferase